MESQELTAPTGAISHDGFAEAQSTTPSPNHSEHPSLYGTLTTQFAAQPSQSYAPDDPNAVPGSPTGTPRTMGATTKSNVTPIAGGVVGAVVALILIALGVCLLMRRRKKKEQLSPSAEFMGKNASFFRVPSFVAASYRHHPPSSFVITKPTQQGPPGGASSANPFSDPNQPVHNPPYVSIYDSSPPQSASSPSPFDDVENSPLHPSSPPSSSFATDFKYSNQSRNVYFTP